MVGESGAESALWPALGNSRRARSSEEKIHANPVEEMGPMRSDMESCEYLSMVGGEGWSTVASGWS